MKNNARSTQTESKPFIENVYAIDGGNAYLVGSKCVHCGQIYFPSNHRCVECDSDAVEPVKFGVRGKLYSFTTSHMASANFPAPYTAGFIELEDGLRIFAPLRTKKNQVPDIGADVVLVIDELWRNGEIGVMGYAYEVQ